MPEMETFAIAARLHVVLRRAHGRVTDVEWMTRNREYAREVIRLAREHADAELRDLADKLEANLAAQRSDAAPRRPAPVEARLVPAPVVAAAPRYVGSLR